MAESTQPITLGELTALFEERPQDQPVTFDFCGLYPDGFDSYRGYYDHLAIGYTEPVGQPVVVSDFLGLLRNANGAVLQGYKGGDFRMTRKTPVWAANYGHSGGTAVVGIAEECRYVTIVRTAYCENWAGAMESARRSLREQGFPV